MNKLIILGIAGVAGIASFFGWKKFQNWKLHRGEVQEADLQDGLPIL